MSEALLQLQNISVRYGGVKALDEVNLCLDEGEIVALMGPNGAGKSTILKAMFGLVPIYSGSLLWHEKPIVPLSHEMAQKGIAFVPQGRRVFSSLNLKENLEIGAFFVKDKEEVSRRLNEALKTFPALKEKLYKKAGTLSGGEQQMLAIARGLMADPKVLLLDEPSLGLAPKIVKEVFAKIKEINERHKRAMIVVEHNIKSLLEIANHAYVLDKGKVIKEGDAPSIAKSDILERVFLGKASS